MSSTHTTITYDEAFARARRERSEVFRSLLSFRVPAFSLGFFRTARHA